MPSSFKIFESEFHPDFDILEFGKHEGKYIGWLETYDPKYLKWMCDTDPYCRQRYGNKAENMIAYYESEKYKEHCREFERKKMMKSNSMNTEMKRAAWKGVVINTVLGLANRGHGLRIHIPEPWDVEGWELLEIQRDSFAGHPDDFGNN